MVRLIWTCLLLAKQIGYHLVSKAKSVWAFLTIAVRMCCLPCGCPRRSCRVELIIAMTSLPPLVSICHAQAGLPLIPVYVDELGEMREFGLGGMNA
jgi:hypothetical protein